ncbi:hypothetical protein SAMN06296273_2532 [Nitrosomonas ureae]|uniref:Uncharacterized protein n=1 Tax=Nitrosomonas ureae TaxID=44577 RepID=A0A285C0H3_9PROT|nr:hypothetical protein [Nitrosomonas ureae]SNX61077.1 hypothetical protein SAMN06296273_2532 [Nitrosomonas ureae]
MSGTRIRQKFAKKRSLHGVNEHFSRIFNAIIVPRSNRAKVSLNTYYPKNTAFNDRLNITVFEVDIGEDDDGPFTATIPALKKDENSRESSLIIEAEGAEYQISYKLSRMPNR